MASKDVLEIRVTFREDQKDLYNYIKNHNSSSGFLKDLAYREMIKDENYIKSSHNNNSITINDIQNFISSCFMQQFTTNTQQCNIPQQPIENKVVKNNEAAKKKHKKNPDLDFSNDDVDILQKLIDDKNSQRN